MTAASLSVPAQLPGRNLLQQLLGESCDGPSALDLQSLPSTAEPPRPHAR